MGFASSTPIDQSQSRSMSTLSKRRFCRTLGVLLGLSFCLLLTAASDKLPKGLDNKNSRKRDRAVAKITDQNLLTRIALEARFQDVRVKATAKVFEPVLIEE